MKSIKRSAAIVAIAALHAMSAPQDAKAAEGDFAVSPEGHRFRVHFDPASRIRIGAAGAAWRASDGQIAPTLELLAGIQYRTIHTSGKSPVRVSWQVDQRFIHGWVAPLVQNLERAPALDAALYGISAHRHDDAPKVVLPLSPPVGVPFPFDIGVDGEVGRVWLPRAPPLDESGARVPFLRIGVVHATGFLDPLRLDAPGRSLEIGVGVHYDIDLHGAPARAGSQASLAPTRIVHRVAPMTAGSVRFRYQTQDGLLALDVRGEVVPHWMSEGRWDVAGSGFGHLERTLLAVNDEPIAATLEGGYRFVPAALGEGPIHDMRVSLGLTFGIDLTGERR